MRRWMCVPMMTLCLLLSGCGTEREEAKDPRAAYQDMAGCTMEAVVTCDREGYEWTAGLRCDYTPGGEISVEITEPELLAGVRAVVTEENWRLEYQELCLDMGEVSAEEISPMVCLPRLMDALRSGWLLEENEETWAQVPCLRLTVDQTGENGGKIYSTLWLRQEDGTPLRGEIAVDGESILTAEFTNFSFCDTMNQ